VGKKLNNSQSMIKSHIESNPLSQRYMDLTKREKRHRSLRNILEQSQNSSRILEEEKDIPRSSTRDNRDCSDYLFRTV
jgi:hypothetical protein